MSDGITDMVPSCFVHVRLRSLSNIHGGSGTLGLHAERFEDGFLANPTSCE